MLSIGLSKEQLLNELQKSKMLTHDLIADVIDKNNATILESLDSPEFARFLDKKIGELIKNKGRFGPL